MFPDDEPDSIRFDRRYLLTGVTASVAAMAAGEWGSRLLMQPQESTGIHAIVNGLTSGLAAETETLVVGSSHVLSGFHADAWGASSYVAALGSQDIHYGQQLVSLALERMPRLQWIIMGVDLNALGYSLDDHDPYLAAQHVGAGLRPLRPPDLSLKLGVHSYLWRYRPVLFREALKKAMGRDSRTPEETHVVESLDESNESNESNENRPVDETEFTREMRVTALQRTRMHFSSQFDSTLIPTNVALLEQVSADVRARAPKIRLLLVTAPLTASYRAGIPPSFLTEFLSSFENKMPTGAHLLRMNDSASPEFGLGDFVDADHLNARGAKRWTRSLWERTGPNK